MKLYKSSSVLNIIELLHLVHDDIQRLYQIHVLGTVEDKNLEYYIGKRIVNALMISYRGFSKWNQM